MCMEDIRIGRKTKVALHSANLIDEIVQIVDDEPHRTQLAFYPGVVAGYVGLRDGYDSSFLPAIYLPAGGHPVIMTVETHGQLVSKAWVGRSADGTTIGWSEGILDDK